MVAHDWLANIDTLNKVIETTATSWTKASELEIGECNEQEEATLLGFEIVAYAGEARSYLLEALKAAEKR